MRAEQTVFDELASLCASKGFLHAVAIICLRDTVVGFAGDLSSEDLASMRSRSQLIRTEITTLIGLAMRGPIDFSLLHLKFFLTTSSGRKPYWKNSTKRCCHLRRAASMPTVLLLPTPTHSHSAAFSGSRYSMVESPHTPSSIVTSLLVSTMLTLRGYLKTKPST